jgi:thiamine-phosphate pyrophosphorylase
VIPRLWLCADLGHPEAPSIVERVAAVLAVTPACVWLRSPHGTSARALLTVARSLRALTRDGRGALFVGDRIDVAALSEADGVHLTGRSFSASEVRARFALQISAATHDDEAITAHAPFADVLLLSPFNAVEGKAPPLGPSRFAALRSRAPYTTVIALGGITTADDARAARAAGADGVALRRNLFADDPAAACSEIARVWPTAWLTRRADDANTSRDP